MSRLPSLLPLLLLLVGIAAMASCRPRVKVKPRVQQAWVKKNVRRPALRTQRPANNTRTRPHSAIAARNRGSKLQRFTDFQVDNMIDGLLKEGLGVEDMKDQYQRMSQEKQRAVRQRVLAQPQRRGAAFQRLRLALRSR